MWLGEMWLEALQSRVQDAAAKVQETIEHERKEFLDEYTRCQLEADPAAPNASASTSASAVRATLGEREQDKVQSALEEATRVGAALFNPFEDQVRWCGLPTETRTARSPLDMQPTCLSLCHLFCLNLARAPRGKCAIIRRPLVHVAATIMHSTHLPTLTDRTRLRQRRTSGRNA